MSHGLNVEVEIERHRSMTRATSHASYQESSAQSQSASYPSGASYMTPDTTVSASRSPQALGAELAESKPGPAYSYPGPQTQYSGHSGVPSEATVPSGAASVVADSPGVFDQDPQLQVDFILA